jgi:tRNA threonylcarbamoyladenosine biosynthesis protein TsaB
LLVALESRRADLYVQLFARHGSPLCQPAAILPDALTTAVAAAIGDRPLAIAGDAAIRAAAVIAGRRDVVVVEPSPVPVVGLVGAALRRWRGGERCSEAKPLYLRPPDVVPAGQHAPKPS